jgi:hypothetical protein
MAMGEFEVLSSVTGRVSFAYVDQGKIQRQAMHILASQRNKKQTNSVAFSPQANYTSVRINEELLERKAAAPV